jgi:uncharacterized protein with GYD domain
MPKAASILTVEPGRVDDVASKVRSVAGVKDVLTVTGRADVVAFYEGSYEKIVEIAGKVGTVPGVVTGETLFEVKW